MLPGHHPEHLETATSLVDRHHPELARFEIKRCVMSDRPSGRWLFVLTGGRELAFRVDRQDEPKASKTVRPKRRAKPPE